LEVVAMRWFTVGLLVLIGAVWADLLVGRGSLMHVRGLQRKLDEQVAANEAARARNVRVQAEVNDLKNGQEMVEERARSELGMLRPDEILVQVTRRK
jgi:cell division protein FtsB